MVIWASVFYLFVRFVNLFVHYAIRETNNNLSIILCSFNTELDRWHIIFRKKGCQDYLCESLKAVN